MTFWSPNINIFRDPRWGRGQETYGEDPFLTSRIAASFVEGLQGNDPKYFKVISTPKHYAVHSGPEPMRHSFYVVITKRDLYETYLPAFEACIKQAGARSVMGAYNSFLGVPCCASQLLLDQILRKRWRFQGYAVSDCGAIWDIYNGHKFAKDAAEASAIAVKAGCDLTCGNEYRALLDAMRDGLIAEKEIDVSVLRLMTARIRLGMFDPPKMVEYAQIPIAMNDTEEHDLLSRTVARESIVLLKNSGSALPLSKSLKSIAVIGPNADDVEVFLGNYNGLPSHPVTVFQGIKNKVGTTTRVVYARGSELVEGMIPKMSPVPSRNLKTVQDGKSVMGLTGAYYTNMNLTGEPSLKRIDEKVDFDWSMSAPDSAFPADSFSVRWTGKLVADKAGTYNLGMMVDDGFRLFIDGKMFLEEWKDGGERAFSEEIQLNAGEQHDIRMEYYEKTGDAVAGLVWSPKSYDPFAEALSAARQSDQVVLVLGLSPQLEGEEMPIQLEGFSGGDRTSLDLPGSQMKLMQSIVALSKPTVLVLLNGSAVSIGWAKEHVSAIVEAWYPGQQGGAAVADVLFGDYNPGGRLPVTFYKAVNDLPPFEEYSMKGQTYRYFRREPLYPFGFGMSLTQFEYKKAVVHRAKAEKKTLSMSM